MKVNQVVGGVFGVVFRLLLTAIMIMVVYRFSVEAYNMGYEVFADIPAQLSPGVTRTVTLEEGTSDWTRAKVLEEHGIVSDARVFFVQMMLSDYKKDIKAGTYALNSSMKSSEILAALAGVSEENEDEESDS